MNNCTLQRNSIGGVGNVDPKRKETKKTQLKIELRTCKRQNLRDLYEVSAPPTQTKVYRSATQTMGRARVPGRSLTPKIVFCKIRDYGRPTTSILTSSYR